MEAPAISGPTILLRSGNYFDLQDPSASRFEPTDDDCALIRFLSPEDARAAFFARYHYIRCAS